MKIEIDILKLGILNKYLPLKKCLTASYYIPLIRSLNFPIDENTIINSVLLDEITFSFNNLIRHEMSSCNEDYLYLLNLSTLESTDKLYQYLLNNNYDFIISSHEINRFVHGFAEPFSLHPEPVPKGVVLPFDEKVSNPYHRGKIGHIDCYIDSQKEWNNKEIICGRKGNSFSYNYKFDVSETSDEIRLTLRYNISLNKESFMKLHFLNEYDPKYKNFFRDKKLEDLL